MSKPVFLNSKVVYHDNSREYHIDARGKDLSSIMRAIEVEDIQPAKKEQVVPDDNSKKEQVYKPTIPKEGDYNEVREYIELRKKYDEDFRTYWDGHTLKQNCANLSKEFKWLVDEHSLGANLNRHR